MLVLLLDLYRAPRTIRADGCYSTPVIIYNSITQGCARAIDMARGMLYELLDQMHIQHPRTSIREWVDDLHQRVQGTLAFVTKELTTTANQLVQGLHRLNLNISNKSTLVCTHKEITTAVQKTLWDQHRLRIGSSHTGRDLGIDNSVGRRRRTPTTAQRKTKARLKNPRVKRIAALGGPGLKLHHTSTQPQFNYGHQALGMAPTTLQQLL